MFYVEKHLPIEYDCTRDEKNSLCIGKLHPAIFRNVKIILYVLNLLKSTNMANAIWFDQLIFDQKIICKFQITIQIMNTITYSCSFWKQRTNLYCKWCNITWRNLDNDKMKQQNISCFSPDLWRMLISSEIMVNISSMFVDDKQQ